MLQNQAAEQALQARLVSMLRLIGWRTESSVYAARGVACVAVIATSELFMACAPARSTSSAHSHKQRPLHAQPPSLLHLRLQLQLAE